MAQTIQIPEAGSPYFTYFTASTLPTHLFHVFFLKIEQLVTISRPYLTVYVLKSAPI